MKNKPIENTTELKSLIIATDLGVLKSSESSENECSDEGTRQLIEDFLDDNPSLHYKEMLINSLICRSRRLSELEKRIWRCQKIIEKITKEADDLRDQNEIDIDYLRQIEDGELAYLFNNGKINGKE